MMGFSVDYLRRVVVDLMSTLVEAQSIIMTGSVARNRRMALLFEDAGAVKVSSASIAGAPNGVRERFGFYETALSAPTQAFRDQLDALDPEQTAVVYAGSFTAVPEVAGRPVIGNRKLEHLGAEHKTRQDTFTGRAGTVQSAAFGLSHLRRPTVVQGVPTVGVAMAASHTYVLPPYADERSLEDLGRHLDRDCDQLVLHPFDFGTPCTFYGFITPQWSVDFGPVEGLVYWHPSTWQVSAPGIVWPLSVAPSEIHFIRRAVHETARRLHEQTGYVGAYGTDGVVHDGQYTIHEINPRMCAGFRLLDNVLGVGPPLAAVDLVLRELGSAAANTLREPLRSVVDDITRDSPRSSLQFDSGDIMKSLEAIEIHRRSLTKPDLVSLYELKDEWSM